MHRRLTLLLVPALALCLGAGMGAGPLVLGGAAVLAAVGLGPVLAASSRSSSRPRHVLPRPADWVTVTRLGLLKVVTVTVLMDPAEGFTWQAVLLAIPMLALDAADGAVARATAPTAAGARFDERVDASVVLVFSATLVPLYGWWCLLLGTAHFAFITVARVRPAWRRPLPPTLRRRVIAALQGPLMLAAGSPLGQEHPLLGWPCVLIAAGLLTLSFGMDIVWIEVRARRRGSVPDRGVTVPREQEAHEYVS